MRHFAPTFCFSITKRFGNMDFKSTKQWLTATLSSLSLRYWGALYDKQRIDVLLVVVHMQPSVILLIHWPEPNPSLPPSITPTSHRPTNGALFNRNLIPTNLERVSLKDKRILKHLKYKVPPSPLKRNELSSTPSQLWTRDINCYVMSQLLHNYRRPEQIWMIKISPSGKGTLLIFCYSSHWPISCTAKYMWLSPNDISHVAAIRLHNAS